MSAKDSKQFKLIEKNYNVGTVLSSAPIESGVTNKNYVITTNKGQYVLRDAASSTVDNQIKNMVPLVGHLRAIGYPTADIISAKNRKPYVKRFRKTYILMSYEPGEQGTLETLNAQRIENFGTKLAELHKLSWNFAQKSRTLEPGYFLTMYKSWLPKVTKNNFPGQAEFIDLMHREYQIIQTDLPAILEQLPRGIVHNDPTPWNVLFMKDKVSSVLDFEAVGNGAFLFDIARAINLWCFDQKTESIDAQRLKTFIKAYNQTRKLTDQEKHYLLFMLKVVAFRHTVYFMRMFIQKRADNPAQTIDFKCLRYYQKSGKELDLYLD